jgi:AcrR family transcriptional regulator
MAARPRQVSDEEILKVAADCFLAHGPGVSTTVIAEQLNISQPALFKRFNTKEELMLRALLPPERPRIADWLDGGPSDGPIRPQLAALTEKMWQMVSFTVPRISIVNASGVPHEVIKKRYRRFPLIVVIESLAGWIERAQKKHLLMKSGHALNLALAWIGTLQGRALLRYVLSDVISEEEGVLKDTMFNDDDYMATITELLWRSIGYTSESEPDE